MKATSSAALRTRSAARRLAELLLGLRFEAEAEARPQKGKAQEFLFAFFVIWSLMNGAHYAMITTLFFVYMMCIPLARARLRFLSRPLHCQTRLEGRRTGREQQRRNWPIV